MKVVNQGTKHCECCGTPLFDYIEYEDGHGGLDGEITHVYCSYENDICKDCQENEEEGEEE